LTATGPGGATTSQATVTVLAPIPPPPPPSDIDTMRRGGGDLPTRISSLQDVYFDYDKNDVGAEAQSVLAQNATALKAIFADFPNANIVIEGHCDERGSAEYNLGLGDRRASSVKEYLVQLGVPAEKLNTISYGKERPQCTEQNESCWQKNRRAHFASGQ
jgi:peptidoglycan-associated lipoprotein